VSVIVTVRKRDNDGNNWGRGRKKIEHSPLKSSASSTFLSVHSSQSRKKKKKDNGCSTPKLLQAAGSQAIDTFSSYWLEASQLTHSFPIGWDCFVIIPWNYTGMKPFNILGPQLMAYNVCDLTGVSNL
jgi:hypothetical protein